MRRIYPPPFNKLGVFVLYCLLSITVITLAQTPGALNPGCKSSIIDPGSKQLVTVGYVHIFEHQPNKIDLGKVPWGSYDFINVIGYPPDGGDDQWNNIFPPKEPKAAKILKPIFDLTAKKPSNAKTKVLLSIRDYNLRDWPADDGYEFIINQAKSVINSYKLDGVDIEYPGMRGSFCHDGPPEAPTPIWDKAKRDEGFVKFMGDLRTGIGKDKTLMLTVGSDFISFSDGLNDSIDYLNIEIYHYSLYENIKNPMGGNEVMTHPNAPNDKFEVARTSWVDSGIGKEKIIMGVDFGNTFQFVVDNQAIKTQQSVQFTSAKFLDLHPNPKEIDEDIKPINNICPDDSEDNYDKLQLFSWPWKSFLAAVTDNNCDIKQGYTRKFDQMSMTPWLYKLDPNPDNRERIYHFVSYEDTESLSNKLNFSISKSIGGISVSDITYDDDDGSLMSLVQAIRGPKSVPSPDGSSETSSGKSPEKTTPTSPGSDSNNTQTSGTSDNTGKIIGGVIGSLFGFAILGLFGFIGYRYHKERPKSFTTFLKSFPNRNAYSSSGNHGALRNTEIPPDTTNRGQVNNTIIPIASGYVTAMFDFTGKEENDLSFKKGDKIEVLERGDGPNDWWVGRVNGAVGEFPGNYVKET